LAGNLRQNLAVGVDGDVGRILRHSNAGLNDKPVRGHDLAGRAHLKRAGAGIGRRAVRHLDLKKAATLDREIEGVVGVDEVTLPGDAIDGRRFDAGANLNADGNERA
jgi:hypothetical protein